MPKTIFAPSSFIMSNLVPQDVPHPLYQSETKRANFLRDQVVIEPVNPKDKRINTPEGLTVWTFSGKPITIKRDSEGLYFTLNQLTGAQQKQDILQNIF